MTSYKDVRMPGRVGPVGNLGPAERVGHVRTLGPVGPERLAGELIATRKGRIGNKKTTRAVPHGRGQTNRDRPHKHDLKEYRRRGHMTGCQGARVLVLPGLVGRHNATRLIPMLPTAAGIMLESYWNHIAL